MDYIGRTYQRLKGRINQHVPVSIQKDNFDDLHKCINTMGLTITVYLLNNHQYA